jgi:type II secretory pathway predicted ATPase ExeA
MPEQRVLTSYGLKYDPFLPSIPAEDLWLRPGAESFAYRVQTLILDGGFALIGGEPGVGKSKLLHWLAVRLEQLDDVAVGVMEHPQSNLSDFYRELGQLFGVNLRPANRYGGFRALRARWREHIKSTLYRPVLLVDEAQEMPTACLNELRMLGSAHFDSECLLTTILCGDTRLTDRFRSRDLLPIGSRIRTRMVLTPLSHEELVEYLEHILEHAGAPHLMTEGLRHTLAEHAVGNPRVLANMAEDLLNAAARRDQEVLDEQLFLEVVAGESPASPKRRTSKRKKR